MDSQQITTLLVTLGLALLAFLFTKREKIFGLFAPRKPHEKTPPSPQPAHAAFAENIDLLSDLDTAASQCRKIAGDIGPGFKLAELYRRLETHGWPHPHLTIRSLREHQMLVPGGDGLFQWNLPEAPEE
jgi:hypothetical protein